MERLTKSSSKNFCLGKGKIRENSGLGTEPQSYQRSWKNSRLEKRNVWENSCLQTGTLIDSNWLFLAGKGNIGEISRLCKGNIFPARKSLVSDIPAGSRERNWDFYYSVMPMVLLCLYVCKLYCIEKLIYNNVCVMGLCVCVWRLHTHTHTHTVHTHYPFHLLKCILFESYGRSPYRGWILVGNPDKRPKSFPPCYSQSSLQLWIEISISSNSRNLLKILEFSYCTL